MGESSRVPPSRTSGPSGGLTDPGSAKVFSETKTAAINWDTDGFAESTECVTLSTGATATRLLTQKLPRMTKPPTVSVTGFVTGTGDLRRAQNVHSHANGPTSKTAENTPNGDLNKQMPCSFLYTLYNKLN